MRTRPTAAAGIAVTILIWMTAPAVARPHQPEFQTRGHATGSGATVEAWEHLPGRAGNAPGLEQARVTMAVPACPGHDPNTQETGRGSDAPRLLCPVAVAMCANAPGNFLFWIFSGPPGEADPQPGEWTRTGQRCLAQEGPGPRGVSLDLDDLRRLSLPPATVTVQPATRTTLVGLPVRLSAEAGTTVITTRLLGRPVRVRARPVRLHWDFGDGTASAMALPTTASPTAATTTLHAYPRTGTHSLTLTTAYDCTYSVAGGPWLPVEGFATVPSPAVLMTVRQSRAELVAQ